MSPPEALRTARCTCAAILEYEHGLSRDETERARRLGCICPVPRKPAML